MGPMVGLIGAILTYMAFYEQYRANQFIVRRQIEDEFNRRFELYLREFRFSIEQWYINPSIRGRACAKSWISEWNDIVEVIRHISDALPKKESKDSNYKSYSLAQDIAWFTFLEGYWFIDNVQDWGYESLDSEFLLKLLKSCHYSFEQMLEKTRYFTTGEVYEYTMSYGEELNFEVAKRRSSHSLFQSYSSNLVNSMKLLDALMRLIFIEMDAENVDSRPARSVIISLIHGDVAQLYALYQKSRFGSQELREYAFAIHRRSFDELGIS